MWDMIITLFPTLLLLNIRAAEQLSLQLHFDLIIYLSSENSIFNLTTFFCLNTIEIHWCRLVSVDCVYNSFQQMYTKTPRKKWDSVVESLKEICVTCIQFSHKLWIIWFSWHNEVWSIVGARKHCGLIQKGFPLKKRWN